jgi:phage-related protein
MKRIKIEKPTSMTEDDPDTLDMLYEQVRVGNLPEQHRRIAINHQVDQWEATTPVVEQSARELRRRSLRQ